MKASEAKAKAPSEYYNKYFKRGRSELLWLIQKPKNPPGNTKRKRDDDGKQGDSDEDRKYTDTGGGMGQGVGFGEENVAVRHNTEMAMIPRAEYNSLRTEVRTLQQQQNGGSSFSGLVPGGMEDDLVMLDRPPPSVSPTAASLPINGSMARPSISGGGGAEDGAEEGLPLENMLRLGARGDLLAS